MRCCIHCKHFRDAHYSKTYISPQCVQRGTDSAAYMRAHVCGLDGKLFEPKEQICPSLPQPSPPN